MRHEIEKILQIDCNNDKAEVTVCHKHKKIKCTIEKTEMMERYFSLPIKERKEAAVKIYKAAIESLVEYSGEKKCKTCTHFGQRANGEKICYRETYPVYDIETRLSNVFYLGRTLGDEVFAEVREDFCCEHWKPLKEVRSRR